MNPNNKTMRDVFIEELYKRMGEDSSIFFLSADFGSPKLDKLRADFSERFINVGIAEQNLINISTGLALEGYNVYAYAIAPFLTMRAYEQIRVNLALQGQIKSLNVNLIGVGAGVSYDVSGPTHHCLEDIIIMRALPNLTIFSPSDWVLTKKFVDYSRKVKGPKYLRLDGKPLGQIYNEQDNTVIEDGFSELKKGKKICLVSTGFMTHKAIKIAKLLEKEGIDAGVIDVFLLRPLNENLLFSILKSYRGVFTLEEGFIDKGGMDSLIRVLLQKNNCDNLVQSIGFKDAYAFDIGSREYLHKINGLGESDILDRIKIMAESIDE